ncbi:MAG: DUF120 domain-containing protein [Candidatus Hodarchaeota archaeon]
MLRLLILVAQLGGLREGANLAEIRSKAEKSLANFEDLLLQAIEEGYLVFAGTTKNRLWIAQQGRQKLEQTYHELSLIFAGIPMDDTTKNYTPARIEGILESGLGEAGSYVAIEGYSRRFQSLLGYVPFPGTLNVRMITEKDKTVWNMLLKTVSKVIPEFDYEGRRYGMVHLWEAALVEPYVRSPPTVAIIRPFRTQHTGVFEVISPEYLRDVLSLQDGTKMAFEVMLAEE